MSLQNTNHGKLNKLDTVGKVHVFYLSTPENRRMMLCGSLHVSCYAF